MSENNGNPLRRLSELLDGLTPAEIEADPALRLVNALILDESFTHTQAEEELPNYVIDEMLGRDIERLYPTLHRHLLNCEQCGELHSSMLMDMVDEPTPVDIPPLPKAVAPAMTPVVPRFLDDPRTAALEAASRILSEAWPEFLDELVIVGRTFFRQVDQLGDAFILRPVGAKALGFGTGDVLLSQRVLAAAYRANQVLSVRIQSGEIAPDDLSSENDVVKAIASDAAIEMGLKTVKRQEFVTQYLSWIAIMTIRGGS